jgi:pyruvate,orthophosphate dikinase
MWGPERAIAALDGFIDLDQRVKAAVTAWQMRDPDAGVINDHSDAAYDADVLERLAAVHGYAIDWLATQEDGCPRLATYGTRLDLALASARGGDGRYVASPRVDSYHGIWFELHEDLIGLAGRTRAAEVEAGRA